MAKRNLKPLKKVKKKVKSKKSCCKMVKESSLYQFIKAITEKRYNAADKYLADVIEAKLKTRIASQL